MTRYAIKGLLARKLRLLLTSLSIVLGVAFAAGTFLFTDSINSGFNDLFRVVNKGTDVVVTSHRTHDSGNPSDVVDPNDARIPGSTLARVRKVDGVRRAHSGVNDIAQLIDPKDGKPIGGHGPPTLGFDTAGVKESDLATGRLPRADDEFVLDTVTARKHHLRLHGKPVHILFRGGADHAFTLVGTFTFGDAQGGPGGATLAAFSSRAAGRLFQTHGKVDEVRVVADPGTSADQLRDRIAKVLGPKYKVQTGDQSTREQSKAVAKGISFITTAMLAFAMIALFVGAFTIFNTFSIIVAQRGRELGLLRALGATRGQVVRIVVIEGLVVGAVSSIVGIALGFALAAALGGILDAAGITFPKGGLALHTRTVVVSLALGVGVTFVASIVPAVRASRVSPIEAMRSGRSGGATRMRPWVVVVGTIITLLGAVLLGLGLGGGRSTNGTLSLLGLGFVVLIIGVALLAPLLVRPAVAVLGWLPRRLGRTPALLASHNTARNPRRTASTAAALMIGVGLVCFAAIFTSSITKTFTGQIHQAFAADFLLTNESQTAGGLDPAIATRLAKLPEVGGAVGFRAGEWKRGVDHEGVMAVDPAKLATGINLEYVGAHHPLAEHTVLVAQQTATSAKLHVGDTVKMTFPGRRTPERTKVVGIYKDNGVSNWLMPLSTYERVYPKVAQVDAVAMVQRAPGVSAKRARKAIVRALQVTPYVKLQDQSQLIDEGKKQANVLLGILTGLLGFALVIALFGIINTLALSIFERTREIGLLRGVGMSRWQARRMILVEAVLIALIGSLLGLALGLGLGWAGIHAFTNPKVDFSVPGGFVALIVVAGFLVGLIASVVPARRAARLDILKAIAAE